MKKKHTVIDLFSGCGGMSLGLYNAGWSGLFAIEKSPLAFATLKHNLIDKKKHFSWPKWLPQTNHDIYNVLDKYESQLKKLYRKVDLVAGGPPCQGFSIAGNRDEKDDRNKLIHAYIDFVSLIKPKLIFFENVKGFTMEFKNNAGKGKKYSEIVTKELTNHGYYVSGKLINFGDYGVPQKRTRFILVGIRKDIKGASEQKAISFFNEMEANRFQFLREKKISKSPSISDAISDLLKIELVDTPDRKGFKSGLYGTVESEYQRYLRKEIESEIPNSHSFAKHSSIIINRLSYILSNSTCCKNLSNKVKEQLGITKQVLVPLFANEQSPTITSNPDDLIHYCEPRILTVREYARIQSFPDNFVFVGKYTTGGKQRKFEVPRYTQIGNAIPPLFGEQSGLILKKFING